ncbi:acyltransferase [Romboutsia sp. CE17]|uniref:acyltransferase family protein n=1 Tax=Romboutsia sp. CE17 TaxID=2724150 RepID=UPI001442A81F|nr:acyltransferase family protein [Romboutsia sp. CE17]QJA09388.1 acyltransferase [Romboutsia sp. CE17]
MNIKRNEKIDFLKGLAIFLVVWGHSIQYSMNKESDYFLNSTFKVIYSFHMPLFMIISGYLFQKSINKDNFKELIYKKIKSLIVPAISWYTLYSLIKIIAKVVLNKSNIIVDMYNYFKGIPYQFWFLFILFYLSIIAIVGRKIFLDRLTYYISIFFILLLLPDKLNIQYLKFMYPYFFIGYFYNNYRDIFIKHKNNIFKVSIVLFLFLIIGWKKDYYIYTTGMSFYNVDIVDKIFIVIYRYVIGIIGSLLVIVSGDKLYKLDKNKVFSKLGKYTLSIYIIQSYLMMVLDKITININNIYIYNYIYTPIISVIIIMICLFIRNLIAKNEISRSILLGENKKKIKLVNN